MSEAISAQGTFLSVGDGTSPEVFTEIPEVRTIPGPVETADEIEVTHLRSLGGRREYLQSFKDTDDLQLEMNYLPVGAVGRTTQQQMLDDFDTGIKRNYRVTYPDNSKATFEAYVKGRGRPAQVGEALMIPLTLRVTGFVDFTDS